MTSNHPTCYIKKFFLLAFNSFIFMIFFCYIALFISGVWDSGTTRSSFEKRSEIPGNDGINSWLPLFFPADSKNINYSINVEADFFYVSFDLEKNKSDEFMKTLTIKATNKGVGFLQKEYTGVGRAWCKLDVIPEQGAEKHIFIIGKDKDRDTYYMSSISDNREFNNIHISEAWAKYCSSSISVE